jgi:hypothetical protein
MKTKETRVKGRQAALVSKSATSAPVDYQGKLLLESKINGNAIHAVRKMIIKTSTSSRPSHGWRCC